MNKLAGEERVEPEYSQASEMDADGWDAELACEQCGEKGTRSFSGYDIGGEPDEIILRDLWLCAECGKRVRE